MPQDTQIFVGDNQAGSSDYRIPGNAEIRVKAVNASFVDNGAAVDWCPAVVMFSDSGSVIARALLPDVKVTAGGDAEVSFFPGVKPGGAAAASSTSAYALGYFDYLFGPGSGNQPVPAGTNVNGKLVNVSTTDAAVMSWTNVGVAGTTLTLHAVGTYLIVMKVLWDTANPLSDSIIQSFNQRDLPHSDYQTNPATPVFDSRGQTNREDFTVAHLATGTQAYTLVHMNQDVVDQAILKQWLSVTYWATG